MSNILTKLRIVSTDFLALRLFCFNIRQHGRQILYFKLHVDDRKFNYRRPQVAYFMCGQLVFDWDRLENFLITRNRPGGNKVTNAMSYAKSQVQHHIKKKTFALMCRPPAHSFSAVRPNVQSAGLPFCAARCPDPFLQPAVLPHPNLHSAGPPFFAAPFF